MSGRLQHAKHLAGRFAGSLSRTPPPPQDVVWVASVLTPGELAVWRLLPAARAHRGIGEASALRAPSTRRATATA